MRSSNTSYNKIFENKLVSQLIYLHTGDLINYGKIIAHINLACYALCSMCNLKIHCLLTIFLKHSSKRSNANYFHLNDFNQLKLILKSSSHNLKGLHLVDIFHYFRYYIPGERRVIHYLTLVYQL